jgi:aminopeptidase N
MDEGLNTFLETETKRERYPEINIEGERPAGITRYMRGSREIMRPIMTSADNIPRRDYGPNAYDKPSAALTLLRETVMGPGLFDKAFKEYSTRWAFKHPKPADFFRTMEDASAVDLDWFWRGWFYTTDAVDVTLDYVKWYRVKKETPGLETRNVTATSGDLTTSGKSNDQNNLSSSPQEFTVVPTSETLYGDHRNRLDEKSLRTQLEGKNLYEVKMTNAGGLVTPVIIQWNYKDGTQETEKIPAEIWRQNDKEFTRVFAKEKEVASVVIDPKREMADIDISDNSWPRKPAESSFERMKKRK